MRNAHWIDEHSLQIMEFLEKWTWCMVNFAKRPFSKNKLTSRKFKPIPEICHFSSFRAQSEMRRWLRQASTNLTVEPSTRLTTAKMSSRNRKYARTWNIVFANGLIENETTFPTEIESSIANFAGEVAAHATTTSDMPETATACSIDGVAPNILVVA